MSSSEESAYHNIKAPIGMKPKGCPVDSAFTTFTDEYLANPYPELERLRNGQPIFYSEKLRSLVVTRMEDVIDIFHDHRTFSSENVQDPIFPVCRRAREILAAADFDPMAVMSNRQQPAHTRIRKFTRDGFSARRMKILEPHIRQGSQRLIDRMLESGAGGPIDFVSSFAHPLPGEIIFRLIGFDEADDEELMSWTSNRLAFTWGKPTDDEQVDIAKNMLSYWRYCRKFVAMRKQTRADDLTSELLDAHEAHPTQLLYREVESIIYGLSFAGHEIVSNFLSNALLCLLPRRDDWSAICENTALIPNALEEVLRYESPQTSWRRITQSDTTFRGIDIPAGTRIFLSLGASNRQEPLFASANEFDIRRKNARKHISFGLGIHFCLGARLARLEAEIAIEALTKRIPSLRLSPNQKPDYSPNITFRGPSKLLVEWDS